MSVANSYTFKLDIAQIRTDNDFQGDVLYTYNGTIFQPVETGEIAVTEGFFVNNPTITLNKDQRKTNIAKSTKQKDYIKLIMTDTDAQALVKEEVKELPYTATLNIKSYEDKEITIKITDIPEGVNAYLLDTGQDTKMNGDVEYTTNTTAGKNADRFKILFKPQQKLTTIEDNHITINNTNRHITITSSIADLTIEVYNTIGQKVHTTKDYTFTLNHLPSGSYLIKAYKSRHTKTEKIVIE